MIKLKSTIILLILLLSTSLFAQDSFVRSGVIPVPAIENGGFGNIVSGLDLDGDGKMEIYAVNDNWGDSGNELIPRIYKYENNGGTWDSVWSATLEIPLQNTWPALATADLDGDGKGEIIWGPVNNTSDANLNPPRVVVFETPGDGSDIMGIPDGSGNYKPNSAWSMIDEEKANLRPFTWFVKDVDSDGVAEIVFADRVTKFYIGIISVDNIPDNGDASETWTLEFKGLGNNPEFVRSAAIMASKNEPGGFGNIIGGLDLDGDGNLEIYAVNDNWNDAADELIPRIYKFEWNGHDWAEVWMTELGIPAQNTWPALTTGDLDKDGKGELIWGPVNATDAVTNPTPPRVVIFEAAGDGSDVLGVADGNMYKPNASWTIVPDSSENERPFKWVLTDLDQDGKQEIAYSGRAGMKFGIISVDNIPDNADGSENWSLVASSDDAGAVVGSGTQYDCAVMNNTFYLISSSGNVTPIKYESGAYVTKNVQSGLLPGGSWKSASVVDIDSNGVQEMVVGMWSGGSIVRLLQVDGDTLKATTIGDFGALGSTRLNGGSSGDIDGDGFIDFVYGSRSGYSTQNAAVYRLKYLGGDITSIDNYEESIIDSLYYEAGGQFDVVNVADIDGDGNAEVMYSGVPRGIEGTPIPIIVVDYSTGNVGSGTKYDVNVIGNTVYGFDGSGNVFSVKYTNNKWQVLPTLKGAVGTAGSFKGSASADIDGDGIDEIVVGAWGSSGTGDVYLLQQTGGGLKSTKIADLGDLGAVQLNGAAAGDIDADGFMDFVFGSRGSLGAIYRLEYRGGDITDPANYAADKIDELGVAAANQADIISIGNLDDDADLEIAYSGIPRDGALFPITILDLQKVQAETIAAVKVDANGDFIADRVGEVVTVQGVVISPTINSLFSLSINIQDATGGINIYSSVDSIYTNVGDLLLITGAVDNFNGLTEIVVAAKEDIIRVGAGTVPDPKVVTAAELVANGEKYESTLVKIKALANSGNGDAWPAAGSNANINVWDGYTNFTMRVDKDLDLAGQTEPVYPIDLVGVATQYSTATPPNNGYQVIPRYYTDIAQNVAAAPSPYFFFTDETRAYDNSVLEVTDSAGAYTMSWHPTVDFNGQSLIYQFVVINPETGASLSEKLSNSNGADTTITFSGVDLVKLIQKTGTDSLAVKLALRTVSTNPAEGIISSVDTLMVTFIDKATGILGEGFIPKEFFVDQNYPNPFNPSTTIQFGLPAQAEVNLIIYDILGREVARLVNNQVMSAGVYKFSFNASQLASGTYIYRLQADKKVEVKKMLLLK